MTPAATWAFIHIHMPQCSYARGNMTINPPTPPTPTPFSHSLGTHACQRARINTHTTVGRTAHAHPHHKPHIYSHPYREEKLIIIEHSWQRLVIGQAQRTQHNTLYTLYTTPTHKHTHAPTYREEKLIIIEHSWQRLVIGQAQ